MTEIYSKLNATWWLRFRFYRSQIDIILGGEINWIGNWKWNCERTHTIIIASAQDCTARTRRNKICSTITKSGDVAFWVFEETEKKSPEKPKERGHLSAILSLSRFNLSYPILFYSSLSLSRHSDPKSPPLSRSSASFSPLFQHFFFRCGVDFSLVDGAMADSLSSSAVTDNKLWKGVFAVSGIMTTLVIYGVLQVFFSHSSSFPIFCSCAIE